MRKGHKRKSAGAAARRALEFNYPLKRKIWAKRFSALTSAFRAAVNWILRQAGF